MICIMDEIRAKRDEIYATDYDLTESGRTDQDDENKNDIQGHRQHAHLDKMLGMRGG